MLMYTLTVQLYSGVAAAGGTLHTTGDHTLYAHLSPFPSQMTGSAMCTMGLEIAHDAIPERGYCLSKIPGRGHTGRGYPSFCA